MEVREILDRPYSRVLQPDASSGTFTAFIKEFPGCIAQGDSPIDAYQNLERAAEFWISDAKERGLAIPQPEAEKDIEYSGRVVLRMPKSVHRRAARAAEAEGVSLNTVLVAAVASYVGSLDRTEPSETQNRPSLVS